MMPSGNAKWFSVVGTLGICMHILSNLLNIVRKWLREFKPDLHEPKIYVLDPEYAHHVI